jgi:3-hydroxyacyl-CoA dehydrogenase
VPKFDTVACVGLGLMGHGIAQVSAQANFKVVAFEQEQRFLDAGRSRIEGSLGKMLKREKISQEQYDGIMNGITYTTDFADLASSDLVVEAVIENMDLKKQLWGELNNVCKPDAIFASNTSSLSITEMADVSGRPDRFVGVHFFNPVQLMKLTEVIRTVHTHVRRERSEARRAERGEARRGEASGAERGERSGAERGEASGAERGEPSPSRAK